jgi:hypothetical protein
MLRLIALLTFISLWTLTLEIKYVLNIYRYCSTINPMARNPSNQQLILTIERSPISWVLEIAAIAGIFCIIVITLQSWANLPNSIPIHFKMSVV